MRKVAVFGNTGGGKSTLAKKPAERTGLPFHPLDLMQFTAEADPVPHEGSPMISSTVLRTPGQIEAFLDSSVQLR